MLLVTPEVAELLYGDNIPPDVIVTINAPDGWPAEQPWPPQVTVPGPPCWGCATGTARSHGAANSAIMVACRTTAKHQP